MNDLKKPIAEKKVRKSFCKLVEKIEFAEVYEPEPELIEGGTKIIFYTILIRLKSLERAYLKDPQQVEAYLKSDNFTRSRDGLVSSSRMGWEFGEDITILNGLGLYCYCDFYIVDDPLFYGYTIEKAREEFVDYFGLNALFFDLVRLYQNYPVIRLKPGIEEILEDEEKLLKFSSQFVASYNTLKAPLDNSTE